MTGPGPRAPRPRLAASLTSASSCGWVEAEGGQAEVTSCATVRVTPRFLTWTFEVSYSYKKYLMNS